MWLTTNKWLFWINIYNMSLNEQMLHENEQMLLCEFYFIHIKKEDLSLPIQFIITILNIFL